MRVCVHRTIDAAAGRLPAVVWMHGGGLVAGTHLIDDERFDRWCPMFGVIDIAVDCGLALERPYPERPRRLLRRAALGAPARQPDLGVDPARIGIGGSRAGGCMAAGLALLARDRDEFPIGSRR